MASSKKRPAGRIVSRSAARNDFERRRGRCSHSSKGGVQIDAIDAGGNFSQRGDANKIVRQILHGLADESACIISSANGTFVDLAEASAIEKELPRAALYGPKSALGESVGASAIWQTIVGAEALRTGQLPQMSRPSSDPSVERKLACTKAIVLSCGLNQQAAGLRLSI